MLTLRTHDLFKHTIFRSPVFVGLFALLLFSCTAPKENPLLSHADSLMTEQPDSALAILENIPYPQKLSHADRALYALLLTQARHKNYITLDNDSLIKVAVDYYGDREKSLRAAQAHYYWGATYRDKERISFAVEEYLKAIQLMPEENEFMAIIYDNLAECYKDDNLYDVAMKAYRKSYEIVQKNSKQAYYALRGIANLFLLENQLDSSLYYTQQAYDCISATQDSSQISILYNDFATIYLEKEEYIRANEYVSKAISLLDSVELDKTYHLKAQIMFGLNQLDSARYYFLKEKKENDIYEKAVRYEGLYQVEKRMGNWKAAIENVDAYLILYDSIQGLSDSQNLARLMDNYQLEEQKKELLLRTKILTSSVIITFFLLIIISAFIFLWNDRKRKKRYISIQEELGHKRLDAMLLKDNTLESEEKDLNIQLIDLIKEQLQLCIAMFEETESYKKWQVLEKATPKQLLTLHDLRIEINSAIRNTFIDVMTNLKGYGPTLTNDDVFYCILSLLQCSQKVIIELMNSTPDALKMRKARIKKKIHLELFKYIFNTDNQ